jgi:hypothetical protein
MTMTTHPDIGEWRAWLDQEAPSPDLDHHLVGCAGCKALVDDLRDAVEYAQGGLALLPAATPTAAETALAHQRLRQRQRGGSSSVVLEDRERVAPSAWQRFSTPWRVAASGIAAAALLTLVVTLTPEGQAAASGFLAQFRSQGVAAVEITPQTQTEIVKTMNALGNLGSVQMPGGGDRTRPETTARDVASQAQTVSLSDASKTVGFAVQTPDPSAIPSGVDKTPTVRVTPATQVRFTFDKKKAAAYYQSTGRSGVNIPDKFDGATLVVSIPSATLLQYVGNGSSSKEALIVAQAGELVVDVEGGKVSLDEMRDFLLGLPGLPSSVVSQLKQIKNWNQTLPIPVPVDVVNWTSTTFKGNQGLLLNDNSGVGSAAIWHENGHLIGVAGSLKANDLKKIAESLAVR